MNGIVRHIVINLYDTFNIVASTNCLILIYQIFLQQFNVFVTYIHISVTPTFYGALRVIMFVLLHLYCMYFCPSWRRIFYIAIQ